MSETFEQLLERWDHYMAKSYYISLSDQKIIRSQLAAQSAKMTELEQRVCDFQAAAMIDVGGMNGPCCVEPRHVERHVTELRNQIAALESQAGALKLAAHNLWDRCMTVDERGELDEAINGELLDAVKDAIESSQAGADLLDGPCHLCGKPTQRFAGDPFQWPVMLPFPGGEGKDRHHHIGCVTDAIQRVQALEAVLRRCRDMAGIYMDCAGHHSDGDDPCPKCELAMIIAAALSQEQATTRNV